ncbi:MAG: hypothetical protein P8J87_16175 [Verrucomicrobiales bacterium]|nr:hypothetical protein [Verrucomicrobiales bacterium]
MKRILGVMTALVVLATSVWAEPLKLGFEDGTTGEEPEGLFVIEGEFTVIESGGGKAIQIAAAPLVETGAIFGESMKNAGGVVSVRVKAAKKRRSYPRFGVGLHGLSGYRLRAVPAAKQLELVKNEEVVATVPLTWVSGVWTTIELSLLPVGDGWKVEGRIWAEGEERPEEADLELEGAVKPKSGKASIWGTPYAGLPIVFDDVEAQSVAVDQ